MIKKIFKIILLLIIAMICGIVLKPIVSFLSGILAFGMGLGLSYLLICWAEDNWTWFR